MTSGTRSRRRHEEHEEHENHERWLVTYADMVTLLMVLFIVMFAMSTVDEKKYESLREGLSDGFGRSATVLSGSNPINDNAGNQSSESTYNMIIEQMPEDEQQRVAEALETADRLRNQRVYDEARVEVNRLLAIWRRIDDALHRQGLEDDVRVGIDERGLVVSLVSRHVIFEPNVATLSPRGMLIVDTLAPILAELREPIEIDGHTNQEKVKPKYFPTDWELSLARAAYVLRRVEERHGIPAARLRATGFGHTKPLIDPSLPDSQRINKRVDVIVLSTAPPETRAHLLEIFKEMT